MRLEYIKDAIGKTVDAVGYSDTAIVIGFDDGTFIAAAAENDHDGSVELVVDGFYKETIMSFLTPLQAYDGGFLSHTVYQRMMDEEKKKERFHKNEKLNRLKAEAARLEAEIGGAA